MLVKGAERVKVLAFLTSQLMAPIMRKGSVAPKTFIYMERAQEILAAADEIVEQAEEKITTSMKASRKFPCPRAKSDMTPCVLRDGAICISDDGVCVGCGFDMGCYPDGKEKEPIAEIGHIHPEGETRPDCPMCP